MTACANDPAMVLPTFEDALMKDNVAMKEKWFSGELSPEVVLFASTVMAPVKGGVAVRQAIADINAQLTTLEAHFRGTVADREFLVFEARLASGLTAHGVASLQRDKDGLVRELTIGIATGEVAASLTVGANAGTPLDGDAAGSWSPPPDYAGPPFLDNLTEDVLLLATIRPKALRGPQRLRDVVVTAGAFYARQTLLFFGSAGERDFMVYEATLESGEEIRGVVVLHRDASGTIREMLACHSPAASVRRLSAHLDAYLPVHTT